MQLVQMDVLDAHTMAEALLLTIDGQHRRLRGNVAHQFIRRWGEESYEDFERGCTFPIALGGVVRVDAETDAPWRTILFASTLHHLDTLDEAGKIGVLQRGLAKALAACELGGIRTLASAPLKGGWRLEAAAAYTAMMPVYDASGFRRRGGRLFVCCRETAEYKALLAMNRRVRGADEEPRG